MVKLIVKDYFIRKRVVDQEKNAINIQDVPYNVRQSIGGVLYNPELRLTMREAIARKPLADSIENCKEDFLYITTDDFKKVKEAFEKIQGFGKDDLELLNRIEQAEEVEVNIEEFKK